MNLIKEHSSIKLITLGSSILKMSLPVNMIDDINTIYDKNILKMDSVNESLAGKIEDEHKISDHLTSEHKDIFKQAFQLYMEKINKKADYDLTLTTAWVNEMKSHEYNPFHFHFGSKSELGLSSVLVLKRPDTYGEEVTRPDNPHNGRLEILGNDQSPLSPKSYRVDAQEGDFFIFPYTMIHGVYPFWGTDQKRRTLSYNCDLTRKKSTFISRFKKILQEEIKKKK